MPTSATINLTHPTFHVERNTADPEVGGYFAYTYDTYYGDIIGNWAKKDLVTRGWGHTQLEAVACLCAVLDEEDGHTWGQAGIAFI